MNLLTFGGQVNKKSSSLGDYFYSHKMLIVCTFYCSKGMVLVPVLNFRVKYFLFPQVRWDKKNFTASQKTSEIYHLTLGTCHRDLWGNFFSLHLWEQEESLAQQLADQLENLPRKEIGFFPVRPPTPGLVTSFYLFGFSTRNISNEAGGKC